MSFGLWLCRRGIHGSTFSDTHAADVDDAVEKLSNRGFGNAWPDIEWVTTNRCNRCGGEVK